MNFLINHYYSFKNLYFYILKNFNEKNKYDEIVLSTYLDINLDNFDQILRQKDNLIFFHFDSKGQLK